MRVVRPVHNKARLFWAFIVVTNRKALPAAHTESLTMMPAELAALELGAAKHGKHGMRRTGGGTSAAIDGEERARNTNELNRFLGRAKAAVKRGAS